MATADFITPAQPPRNEGSLEPYSPNSTRQSEFCRAQPETDTPADAATAIHHIESAREILQRISANVTSVEVRGFTSFADLMGISIDTMKDIQARQSRIMSLAITLRNQLEPEEGNDTTPALDLANILVDLLADAKQEIYLMETLNLMKAGATA